MKVVVAGATGALGHALIPRLAAQGWNVVGLSRSSSARAEIERLGAELVTADVLDPESAQRALAGIRPAVVVHAAKAIPKRGPMSYRDMRATNRLHDEGTRNLVTAAVAAGAQRFVAESVVFAYGYGDLGPVPLTEDRPVATDVPRPKLWPEVAGILAMEAATTEAALDGIVLRCGLFYGPRAGTDVIAALLRRRLMPLPAGGPGVWPIVYVEDVADAVVTAIERGRRAEIYNVVDDEPVRLRDFVAEIARVSGTPDAWSLPKPLARLAAAYFTEVATTSMRVSNDKARRELGWEPAHPSYRDGLRAWAAGRS